MIKNENGATMLIIMILILVLFTYATALWQNGVVGIKHTSLDEKRMQAYYLARAGAVATAKWIEENPDQISDILDKTSDPVTLGNGTFVVEVIDGGDGKIILESIGNVRDITRKVTLMLTSKTDTELDLDMAVFSSGSIRLSANAGVDGSVITNTIESDQVKFGWGTSITGELYVGPGGDPDIIIDLPGHSTQPEDFVGGGIKQLAKIREYAIPEFPDFPDNLSVPPNNPPIENGKLTVGHSPYQNYTISDDGVYSQIDVSNGILTVNLGGGDRIIRVRDLRLSNGQIILQGSGRLILYIDDSFKVVGNSLINQSGDIESLIIYYNGLEKVKLESNIKFVGSIYTKIADLKLSSNTVITGHLITNGSSVDIQSNATFRETLLYAPNADVSVSGNSNLTGAIIAKQINASGNAKITFDTDVSESFPLQVEGGAASDYSQLWK